MTKEQERKLQQLISDGWVAMGNRHDGDVPPEQLTALNLGSGLPSWGWDTEESDLPPPEGGSLVQGLMWGAVISLALWTVILTALYWAVKAGWWR